MGQPESTSHEREVEGVQLAARFRRAKEYQEAFLLYTVWANEKIARGLSANSWHRNPSVQEDPLVARLRLDPRLGRPPHDYGTMSPYSWKPPQLNPYERRPLNPNQIFYVSPDGGLKMTLGQLTNMGRPMFDEAWIERLCTWPPTQQAHRMGVSGGPSNSVEHLLEWLGKHTHVDRPDYTAACLDMYFAGVGVREGVLTPQGGCARKNLGQNKPVTKPDTAKFEAERKKLEAAQAEGRWNISQARAEQIEADKKAERAAAHQTAYELGEIARFEYPEGFDKSKITWSSIGPGGRDLGGDVLYGYDYQGRFIGNRLNGIQDDSGSLFVLGGSANIGKTFIKAMMKQAAKGGVVFPGGARFATFRRTSNVGAFKTLPVNMNLKTVRGLADEAKIGLDGIKVRIIRDETMIGRGFTGYAHPDGKAIDLYPDAFSSKEILVRTLAHERTHMWQAKSYGPSLSSTDLFLREQGAYGIEDSFVDYWRFLKSGGH